MLFRTVVPVFFFEKCNMYFRTKRYIKIEGVVVAAFEMQNICRQLYRM
jgi:hypothetical protein